MKHTILFLSLLLFVFSCSSDNTDDSNTCHSPVNITTNSITAHSALINWTTNNSNSYQIEYGFSGFTQGQGTNIMTSDSSYNLIGLTPATAYDFYITTICSDINYSDAIGPNSFNTEIACQQPTSLNLENVDICSISLNWETNGESSFKVEYGVSGFALGTGRVKTTTENNIIIDSNISQGITYDIYVRANCGSDSYSEYSEALTITTISQDLTGSYQVTVTRHDGFVVDLGIETITLISPNYYKTQTTGHWPIGYYNTDQGYNFENSCGEIIIPDQQLFQGTYSEMVFSTSGHVFPNGNFVVEYIVEAYDDLLYSAFYTKQ
ncbi:fibronectin type III domain-containing protein [Bizionia arctica]|uniref:Fibronectin type-III domain-containing protein n=1 Tax=Bizionia arctica TaxID=1495645 RepID=A0A917LRR2_9FLAO|nr:fibronectin type III domain-containing protein [Bizionia arctica]GGG53703.1 hypothetical protein GCM10010976_25850 [Bizionia arctica]